MLDIYSMVDIIITIKNIPLDGTIVVFLKM